MHIWKDIHLSSWLLCCSVKPAVGTAFWAGASPGCSLCLRHHKCWWGMSERRFWVLQIWTWEGKPCWGSRLHNWWVLSPAWAPLHGRAGSTRKYLKTEAEFWDSPRWDAFRMMGETDAQMEAPVRIKIAPATVSGGRKMPGKEARSRQKRCFPVE